jgi:hypothetical protein
MATDDSTKPATEDTLDDSTLDQVSGGVKQHSEVKKHEEIFKDVLKK